MLPEGFELWFQLRDSVGRIKQTAIAGAADFQTQLLVSETFLDQERFAPLRHVSRP